MISISTGVTLSLGDPSSPSDADRESWTRLFHEQSEEPISHVVDTSGQGILLQAFDLEGDDQVCVEMVVGCGAGTYFGPLRFGNCTDPCLTACRTVLLIPLPLRIRLVYSGSRLGLFNVFASPVPFTHFPALSDLSALSMSL